MKRYENIVEFKKKYFGQDFRIRINRKIGLVTAQYIVFTGKAKCNQLCDVFIEKEGVRLACLRAMEKATKHTLRVNDRVARSLWQNLNDIEMYKILLKARMESKVKKVLGYYDTTSIVKP